MDFLIPGARLAFMELRQAFLKAPIFHHFDLECHIRIETDVSSYAIGGVFSQLTLDNLSWWHPVAFFSHKMISAETRYKTHDSELLAIVETFKTWRHYLEDSQHEVFLLIDHNNLRQFMDTKSLSFKQVRWAQELSCYHFQIDYYQGKANGAADALSQYPQWSVGCSMQAQTLLQSRLLEVSSYLHSNTITAHSGFASPPLRPLIAACEATCPLHCNVASSGWQSSRYNHGSEICVTLISADCFTPCQAACPLRCNMASSCRQRVLLREIIRTHMFPSMSLVISSFTHHSAHRIVRTTDSFPSLRPSIYIDNHTSH